MFTYGRVEIKIMSTGTESKSIKCGGCKTIIKGRQYLKCSVCLQCYDLECANVSESRFYNTLTPEHRTTWKCPLCKNKEPKRDNTNTPIRMKTDESRDENVTIRNPRNSSRQMTPEEPCASDVLSEIKMDIKNILDELRSVRCEMQDFRNRMERLTTDVTTNSKRIDGLSARIEVLEQQHSTIEGSAAGTSSLEDTIAELKQDLNDREQELLSNDVEVAGIPEEKSESVAHIVLAVAKKLGVSMDERDIVSADRVGPIRAPVQGAPPARPRPLVVRLARRVLRGQLLAAARVRRTMDTEGLGLSSTPKPFYINERLTKQNRQLFFKAREASSNAKWNYVWTRDGNIFARRETGAPRHRLKSAQDINRVFFGQK